MLSEQKGELMSVQFGRCNFDGQPVDPSTNSIEVDEMLAPYGPDNGRHLYVRDAVGYLRAHSRPRRNPGGEAEPPLTASGSFIAWDGRLDNREELRPTN